MTQLYRNPFRLVVVLFFATFTSAALAGEGGPTAIPERPSAPVTPSTSASAPAAPAAPAPVVEPSSTDVPTAAANGVTTPNTAPTATMSGVCDDRVKDYVVAGSLTSQALGARTWSLSRLSKAAAKSDDHCAKTLLTRAINEEKLYWDHIRDKFKCADATGKVQASDTCSDHLVSEVKLNLNWLKLFKFVDAPAPSESTEASLCDEACAKARTASEPLSSSNREHLRDAVRAVTMNLPDAAHVAPAKPKPVPAKLPAPSQPVKPNPPVATKAPAKPNPEKIGADGLTDHQREYYKRFNADLKHAAALSTKLEVALRLKLEAQEDLMAKTQTIAERSASQAAAKALRKDLKDIDIAFDKLKNVPVETEPEAPVPRGHKARAGAFNQTD